MGIWNLILGFKGFLYSVFCQKVDPLTLEDIEILDTYMNGRRTNLTKKVTPHKKLGWISILKNNFNHHKNIIVHDNVKYYSTVLNSSFVQVYILGPDLLISTSSRMC